MKIERAVLSCHDKTGIVEFAQLLHELGVEIISTSGTLAVLQKANIPAVSIAEFTGVPEMLDGRVKSLDSKIHAGLLGIREDKVHCEQMMAQGLEWVDLLVANPRPLDFILDRPDAKVEDVMAQVDIGGIALIRSAAKNFRYVTVAVSPARYANIMHELHAHEGQVSFALRYKLAQEALVAVAQYDMALADFLRDHEPADE